VLWACSTVAPSLSLKEREFSNAHRSWVGTLVGTIQTKIGVSCLSWKNAQRKFWNNLFWDTMGNGMLGKAL